MELQAGKLFALITFVLIGGGMLYLINRVKVTGNVPIRRLAGLDAMDEAIGRATEMGRPTHFTLGVGEFDAQTFAGLEVLKYVAKQSAKYDARLIVTNQSSRVYPITEEIVRSAYLQAGKPDRFRPNDVMYLSEQQNAYVAGVIGVLEREKVAANIMVGYFKAESMMFAETGQKVGAIQIAGTGREQIPFFVAVCDYVLIGEEMSAVGAYLNKIPAQVGSVMVQDYGKYASIVLIIAGAVLTTFGNTILATIISK